MKPRLTNSVVPWGLALSAALGALVWPIRDFVIDDAFIIYRFGENLAAGRGLVWNPGEAPVEGFTSLAWVFQSALAIRVGIDPLTASRVIAVAAGLAAVWLLLYEARDQPLPLKIMAGAALALSPPFALMAWQGLETGPAVLLTLLIGLTAVRAAHRPSPRRFIALHGLALIAIAVRPDTAALSGGVMAGLLLALLRDRRGRAGRDLVLTGLPFLTLILAFAGWRYLYFGSLLPTTFLVKVGAGGALKRTGALYLESFILWIALPYLILIPSLRSKDREADPASLPLLGGLLLFGLYLMFINPIQGYLWRFAWPAFPLVLLLLIEGGRKGPAPSGIRGRLAWTVVLAVGLVWPLLPLGVTLKTARERTSGDRVLMGRMLSALDGTMVVSESGAVPYFSKWRSYDLLGLTSARIAREGLTYGLLESINPDLVMLHEVSGVYAPSRAEEAMLNRYLVDHHFVAVAAVHKAGSQFHFYFVRRDSPRARAVASQLVGVPGLTYAPVEELVYEDRLLGPSAGTPQRPAPVTSRFR